VAHLEERIRSHEAAQVKANSQLQKLARKLNLENQKMKKALMESCRLAEAELDEDDAGTLVEKITNKGAGQDYLQDSRNGYSSEIGGISAEQWSSYYSLSHPFPSQPSFPSSHVRYQKPPTLPADPSEQSPDILLLTLAPQMQPDLYHHGESGATPERLRDLVQLLPSASGTEQSSVICYVTYDLLNRLVTEENHVQ
jgi:hypothetical protein